MTKEAIITLISTTLGTVVGWLLNCFFVNAGKVVVESNNFRIVPREFTNSWKGKINISFDLLVINEKQTTCGINNYQVYLKNKNGERKYFTDLTEQVAVCYDNVDLLNIPGRTARSKKIEKELKLWWKQDLKDSVICLDYKINGKKKQYSCIVGEIKSGSHV